MGDDCLKSCLTDESGTGDRVAIAAIVRSKNTAAEPDASTGEKH
ncbi:hypothetical protein N507_0127 [Lacticaseibacillus rhamnosus DSM 14870]|nr:hypothetical protein N507_0127 [Lacticaseibacillus rhamnosus DSM 14870]